MDYEKIHKDALEIAQRLVREGKITEETAKKILPDFVAEDENERIRKKCIELIKRVIPSGNNQSSDSKDILDCIAYLEKQKDQSITENDLDAEIHRFFDDCIVVHEAKLYGNISERVIPVDGYEVIARHFAKWGERHKEQKPADQCDKGRRGRLGGIPEHIRKKAENFLSKTEPPYDADDICSAYETGAMESIKQEWSEEDEKYLNIAINIVSSDFGEDSPTVSWLKSLKDRVQSTPHWKPSEKQMKTLESLPGLLRNFKLDISARMLEVLYEQLKSLL